MFYPYEGLTLLQTAAAGRVVSCVLFIVDAIANCTAASAAYVRARLIIERPSDRPVSRQAKPEKSSSLSLRSFSHCRTRDVSPQLLKRHRVAMVTLFLTNGVML